MGFKVQAATISVGSGLSSKFREMRAADDAPKCVPRLIVVADAPQLQDGTCTSSPIILVLRSCGYARHVGSTVTMRRPLRPLHRSPAAHASDRCALRGGGYPEPQRCRLV